MRKPVKKVLHVLGDKSWKPEYKYLGSTKDIVGRRDYFAERGIECVELQVKGRHDSVCLELLQGMDLKSFDAVLMEHPRYPKSMAYLRKAYPDLLLMIRGHNAELIHQVHTAWAYLNSGVGGSKWRWKRTRITLKNVWDRFRFDVTCARQADYVLAIADWEAKRYWPLFVDRNKILTAPYFVPDSYVVQPPPDLHKVSRVLCTMSADWTPLAHHAAKVMVELVKATPQEQVKNWKFAITGDLGKHRDSYKSLKSGGRINVMGNVANPFEVMMQSRVLAHLSNLGMGFKTKLLDFVNGGGWVLMPKTLYGRQPEEIRPFCIVVDPLTPEGLVKALNAAKAPWPDNQDVNNRLRRRAFAAMDQAFGQA
jgi:hypothetical protein